MRLPWRPKPPAPGRIIRRRTVDMTSLEAHGLAAQLAGVSSFELTAWVLVSLRDEGEGQSILSITPLPDPGTTPVLLEYALASLRSGDD